MTDPKTAPERIWLKVEFTCCGQQVVGAEYMGQQEMICCGQPDEDALVFVDEQPGSTEYIRADLSRQPTEEERCRCVTVVRQYAHDRSLTQITEYEAMQIVNAVLDEFCRARQP